MSGAAGFQFPQFDNLSPLIPTSSNASTFPKNYFLMADESPVVHRHSSISSIIKRSNSVPNGLHFSYPNSQIDGGESSSIISESSTSAANFENNNNSGDIRGEPSKGNENNSDSVSMEEENSEKNEMTPKYLFERRPSSASAGSVFTRYRYSTDAVFTLASPVPVRLRDRGVEKLKREANIGRCIETDYASEKLSITGAAIMGSMDEFNIEEGASGGPQIEQRKRTQSLTEPVHVMTNFLPSPCSPSPTRIEKQCYSPSMQQVVARGIALSPATSPSPNRHHCVRSLSPIAVRGATLKRKYDSDTESNSGSLPAKRIYASLPSTPPFTPLDRFLRLGQPSILSTEHGSLSTTSIDSESSNSTISDFPASSGNSISQPSLTRLSSSFCQPLGHFSSSTASTVANSPSSSSNVAPSPLSSIDLASGADAAMDDT